jgi:hypothetical protein
VSRSCFGHRQCNCFNGASIWFEELRLGSSAVSRCGGDGARLQHCHAGGCSRAALSMTVG